MCVCVWGIICNLFPVIYTWGGVVSLHPNFALFSVSYNTTIIQNSGKKDQNNSRERGGLTGNN